MPGEVAASARALTGTRKGAIGTLDEADTPRNPVLPVPDGRSARTLANVRGLAGDRLDAGAADYVVKPFSPIGVTARVRGALLRRGRPAPCVPGALSIDYESRRVTGDGPRGTPRRRARRVSLRRWRSRRAGRPRRRRGQAPRGGKPATSWPGPR